MITLIALAVLAVAVLIALASAVQIVPQAHAAIIERLGRYRVTLDAGFHTIVPVLDKRRRLVDLREQVVAFPPQPLRECFGLLLNEVPVEQRQCLRSDGGDLSLRTTADGVCQVQRLKHRHDQTSFDEYVHTATGRFGCV